MIHTLITTFHVSISPSHIEEGSKSHPIGYIYLLNRADVSISNPSTVDVFLTSDDPEIASVPEKITFPANAEYAKFDIVAGASGQTTILATINEHQGFTDIIIGSDEKILPGDLALELNLPSGKMHVNSEMPFSVFLKTIDNTDNGINDSTVIRAPYDIEIVFRL